MRKTGRENEGPELTPERNRDDEKVKRQTREGKEMNRREEGVPIHRAAEVKDHHPG
jgi:hypothetical protein